MPKQVIGRTNTEAGKKARKRLAERRKKGDSSLLRSLRNLIPGQAASSLLGKANRDIQRRRSSN